MSISLDPDVDITVNAALIRAEALVGNIFEGVVLGHSNTVEVSDSPFYTKIT